MESTNGLMDQTLKVTSNRDIGMVMEYGSQKEESNSIKDTTYLIENMVMVFMIGEITLFTKDNISRILDQAKVSCTATVNLCTKDFGKTVNEPKILR